MDLARYLASPFFSIGLVLLLMLLLGIMATLKRHEIVKERTAVFVIGVIFLLVILALGLNTQ